MADVIKVLGQLKNPTTLTTLYTVPKSTDVVAIDTVTTISTLFICNRTTGTLTFRVSVHVDGAAIDDSMYLFYDAPIEANTTIAVTSGLTLSTEDVMKVKGSGSGLSFNLFGVETS